MAPQSQQLVLPISKFNLTLLLFIRGIKNDNAIIIPRWVLHCYLGDLIYVFNVKLGLLDKSKIHLYFKSIQFHVCCQTLVNFKLKKNCPIISKISVGGLPTFVLKQYNHLNNLLHFKCKKNSNRGSSMAIQLSNFDIFAHYFDQHVIISFNYINHVPLGNKDQCVSMRFRTNARLLKTISVDHSFETILTRQWEKACVTVKIMTCHDGKIKSQQKVSHTQYTQQALFFGHFCGNN